MKKGPTLEQYTGHIEEKRKQWCLDKRQDLLSLANSEVGPHVKGTPQVLGYWRDAEPLYGGKPLNDFQLRQAAGCIRNQEGEHHCGIFVLSQLKRAGLAKGIHWEIGSGFARGRLPVTDEPQPGDIFIGPPDAWHHGFVRRRYLTGNRWWLESIEANTPDVKLRNVPEISRLVYYSIEPLLLEALDNG